MFAAAAAAMLLGAACGESQSPAAPSASNANASYAVTSIIDGDTLRISPSFNGSASVRLVGIDAPEVGGDTQEPWATASRAHLTTLVPPGTAIQLATDRQTTDTYGRVLARVVRASDRVDVNREQLGQGHAVTYVLWPNVTAADADRTAQIEAQDAGRGIWNPAAPLVELPFEYRLRRSGELPARPTGDRLTLFFVDGASYRLVHVNNRIFFSNDDEAQAADASRTPDDAAPALVGTGPPAKAAEGHAA
jgi:endonuclease YncB( thermonuclease family)